jgi:hypothetical protein
MTVGQQRFRLQFGCTHLQLLSLRAVTKQQRIDNKAAAAAAVALQTKD